MGFLIIVAMAAFVARVIFVIMKSKAESRRKSSLNREIYSHANRIGLSHDDLNEFEVNPIAKEQLKKLMLASREASSEEGKAESLQIAEAAKKVIEIDKKRRSIPKKYLTNKNGQEDYSITIGDLKINSNDNFPDYDRVVSAVFTATSMRTQYKGAYIFLMGGVNRVIRSPFAREEFRGLNYINKIEYTDGLRISKLDTEDDVTHFVENVAVPAVREIFGEEKASRFSDDVLTLYISMSTSLREKVAMKAITHYIDIDDIKMLMKWIEPFDYMVEHMPILTTYLNNKGILIEETEDISLGFYRFHEPSDKSV